MKNKKVAAIYDLTNQSYSEHTYICFKNVFENLGGEVILTKTFTSGKNPNIKGLVEALISSGADGILISANGTDTAVLCQELRKVSIITQGQFPALQQDYYEIDQYGDSKRSCDLFIVQKSQFKRIP